MVLKFKHPPNSNIGRYLNTNKTFYENDLLEDSKKYLFKDAVVLDVGANIGNHSVYWGSLGCKVHSFEPNEKAVEFLRKNLDLNNVNYKIYNCALSNQSGTCELVETMDLGECQIKENAGKIPMYRLDMFGLKPRLLKIDVEGMEYDVLMGAYFTIRNWHPVIYVEIKNNPCTFDQYLRQFNYVRLEKFGYTPTYKYI